MDRIEGLGGVEGVDGALAALQAVSATVVEDAASWGFRTASDFAGHVEELSRTMEFLQLVAASAVDRTRKQSAARPGTNTSWTTGWRESPAGWETGASGAAAPAGTTPAGTAATAAAAADAPTATGAPTLTGVPSLTDVPSPASGEARAGVDDGYRNTAEFLRARLRIGAAEARRRLSLAEGLLPRQGLAGRQVPPAHRELAAAVAAGEVASRAASVIAVALERVRPLCDAGAAARMEHALTRTAAENDADFLVRVTRSWADALDQDGAEPSEELLRQLQGAFIRRRRHGLHHLEIYATTEQFEHLLTVMNTGANPRTGGTDTSPAADTVGAGGAAADSGDSGHSPAATESAGGSSAAGLGTPGVVHAVTGPAGAAAWAADVSTGAETPAAAAWTSAGVSAAVPAPGDHASSEVDPAAGEESGLPALDLRSRAQKLLDGLVGACKVALTAGTLPAAGGLRPQVMATIDYRDLLTRLGTTPDDATPGDDAASGPAPAGPGPAGRTPGQTGTLLFTGPVTASTVRQIACDADIIPVLLGGQGRVLDIGRASRIFPPHIRKALIARDRGCAFPGCTIPATWCEAHHIDYWSRGGTTGTENGTLLCSHHHHVIHKEHWTIQLTTGIPWFIPPPHLDPRRQPRRNHYFHPANLPTAA